MRGQGVRLGIPRAGRHGVRQTISGYERHGQAGVAVVRAVHVHKCEHMLTSLAASTLSLLYLNSSMLCADTACPLSCRAALTAGCDLLLGTPAPGL